MKKCNPLRILLISFFLYWIILYIVASAVDSQHAGGEQYLLIIFAKGIDMFPIIGIILLGIICLIYKEWAVKNKWLLIILLLILSIAFLYILFFNHS